MGGGIISLAQGVLSSDSLLGIQWSYLVGVCCFAYLAFYGIWGYKKMKFENKAI
jgi:FHS family L-fucose permease-like MFS transporter